jgi:hypothetical protein
VEKKDKTLTALGMDIADFPLSIAVQTPEDPRRP